MALKRVDIVKNEGLVGKEIPRPPNLELPCNSNGEEYVKWADVADDVKKYSFFFHKNTMWSARTRKVKDDEKREYLVTYFMRVANFKMEIVVHMRGIGSSMRLVQITNEEGESVPFDTPAASFVSKMIFSKTIEDHGNFLFEGNDTDLMRLKRKLMKEMGKGVAVQVLGWQKKPKLFFYNNCAVNGQVYPINDDGMVTIDDKVYYVPSANKVYEDDETQFSSQKKVRFIQNQVTMRQVLESFSRVHGKHAWLFFPWALACGFHDHIYHDRGFFPIYFGYGHPSTGKGQLVRGGMSLYGEPQALTTITGASTDKSKIRKMAQFRNMIGGFDEYSCNLPDAGQKMIQGYWDGHGYDKATMDNTTNITTIPVRQGAVVLGNDYPTIDALVTRCIIDPFLDDKFTDEQKRNYDVLNEMIVRGYSGVMKDVFKHREAFEKEWLTCWAKAKGDVRTFLGLEPGIVGRMLDNLSVIMAVRWFFDDKIDWPFTYEQVLGYGVECMKTQNLKRDTGGSVANFWECIRQCVKDETLVIGDDFRINGNSFVIGWNNCHNAYLRMHRQQYGKEGDSKHVMADKLKNSPAFVKVRDRDVRLAGVQTYGFEFEASKLGDLCEQLTAERSEKPSRRRKKKEAGETVPLDEVL